MNPLILALCFAVTCAFAQTPAPTIEQLKIAADAGDPAAQDKLAARVDYKSSEIWYRKAAVQGYVHAQGKLGNILFMRHELAYGLKPAEKAALADESLKWATLAANQGDQLGQSDLARMYFDGKLVKTDFIEAYKWGELASHGASFDPTTIWGKTIRDNAVLKMNADQITEAKQRVDVFVPHQPQKSDLPEPAWVQKIKLNGISNAPGHRLAIINGKTFASGDSGMVKISGKTISIRCVEITDHTATIAIEGIEGHKNLTLN